MSVYMMCVALFNKISEYSRGEREREREMEALGNYHRREYSGIR
jgi:hypothetical protein